MASVDTRRFFLGACFSQRAETQPNPQTHVWRHTSSVRSFASLTLNLNLIWYFSSQNERVDPTSEYELGKYAEFSELDDEKAAQHYESAARRGHLQAQLKMAHLLTSGFLKPSGDSSKADADARLYLDMAIMMHDSPEAMVYLANMSFTPENQKRKWLAEAAARLDYPPVRQALTFLPAIGVFGLTFVLYIRLCIY